MEIVIKNKKNYQGKGVYIGRPSPLGNPYKIDETQSRKEVIEKYEIWLKEKIRSNCSEVISALDSLFSILINKQKLILICWCSPKLCHGNIIKDILIHKYIHGTYE